MHWHDKQKKDDLKIFLALGGLLKKMQSVYLNVGDLMNVADSSYYRNAIINIQDIQKQHYHEDPKWHTK